MNSPGDGRERSILQLDYEFTVDDQLAKLDRFVRDSHVGRGFAWFAYFTIVALAWLSAILFYIKQGERNYVYLVSGAFALLLTLTLPRLYRWYQTSFWNSVFTVRAVRGLVGRKRLTIHQDLLEEVGEKLTIRVDWRDVESIEQDPLRIWLIIAPLLAIVVPARAFKTAEKRRSFLQECERLRAAHSRNLESKQGLP